MNFYASLVFLGIVLIVFSLAWVIMDRKSTFGFARGLDEKKQQLVEIINDAEQMIEELNKFSDYIVTQMDVKNEELAANLKTAEESIKSLGKKAQSVSDTVNTMAVNGERPTALNSYEPIYKASGSNPVDKVSEIASIPPARKTDKVIHINNKYSEVVRMSSDGMDVVEIAKTLKLGKGEVELILGINRN